MKKLTYLLIAVLTISLSGCSIFQGGDKSFEGVIKYTIDYEGDIDEETLAQAPTGATEYYKGTKVRKDQESMMYTVGVISDNETDENIVLMDIPMMGEKVAYKQSAEDKAEADAMIEENKPDYTETGETKEILGYTCKKVDVTMGDNIFPLYYTNEINIAGSPNESGQFPGIEGVILEYTVAQQGMVMKFTATEVKKQKLNETMFGVPEDYTMKTAEEMEAMFGM